VRKGYLRALTPFKPLSEDTLIRVRNFSEENETFRIHDGGRCVKQTTGIKGSFQPVAQWKSITCDGIATITHSSMKHSRDRDSPSVSLSISVRRVLDESQSLTVSQTI
jgi:hypothetical protein